MNVKRFWRITLMLGLLLGVFSVNASQKISLESINSLIVQGESYRQNGYLREAEVVFAKVLKIAKQQSEPRIQSLSHGLLGHIYLLQQRYSEAKALLELALNKAEQHGWAELAGLNANYLANYYASQRQWDVAQRYYEQSISWSLKADAPALTVQAQLNLARVANTKGQKERAWK